MVDLDRFLLVFKATYSGFFMCNSSSSSKLPPSSSARFISSWSLDISCRLFLSCYCSEADRMLPPLRFVAPLFSLAGASLKKSAPPSLDTFLAPAGCPLDYDRESPVCEMLKNEDLLKSLAFWVAKS